MRNPSSFKQSGFSLIELLIALAIALVLLIVVSYSYLGTKGANRTTNEQTQIYEEGRYALEALGKDIRLAGFTTAVDFSDNLRFFDGILPKTGFMPIQGCEGGIDTSTYACTSAAVAGAPDAFSVTYFTDNPNTGNNRNLGVGVDCAGQDATAQIVTKLDGTTGNFYYVTNLYFLSSTTYIESGITKTLYQLNCRGSGNATPQPIFKGVRDMQLLYGVASANTDQAVDRLYGASDIQTLGLWDKVISVRVCLLMESINGGATVGVTPYTDCAGVTQNAPNGYIRRAFIATYNLRNRVSQ